MTNQIATPTRTVPSKSSQKRRWRRPMIAGIVALVGLIVLAVAALATYINLPVPSPLRLPTSAQSAPIGQLDGTWDVAPESIAGFQLQETAMGMSRDDVVGRTNGVTGTVAISNSAVISAKFRVDLTNMKVGGKTQSQFATSLDTNDHPNATFTLTQPIALAPSFTSGATITGTAIGQLSMNGASHPVTFTIAGRRDGAMLQVAGSVPIAFSDWGIKEASGFGFFGSLANHGAAEFLIVLHQA